MQAQFKSNGKILRDEWDHVVRNSPQGNVYALSSYLDVVAPEWSGIEVFEKDELIAVMPLMVRRKMGLSIMLQPDFVQYWGPCWLNRPFGKVYQSISWKRKIVQAMVEALPPEVRWWRFACAPEMDYALPFHWDGFDLRTRYTYTLDLNKTEAELRSGLSKNTKYELSKAKDLVVAQGNTVAGLLRLVDRNAATGRFLLTESQQDLLDRLSKDLMRHGEAFVLEAYNAEGRLSAAGFFVVFGGRTIYLASAQEPELRQDGGMTRIVWEAMLMRKGQDQLFDFEGSMLEGVEGFFRGFGAAPIPYLFLDKNRLPHWVNLMRKLRGN